MCTSGLGRTVGHSVKCWWSTIGLNPFRLYLFHVLEWFVMEKVYFLLENKLYSGVKGRNTACDRKYHCK